MTKHFGIYFLFIAFLLISASNLIAQERTNRLKIRERKSPSIGTVVKDFSLKTADGNTFTLSDYRSKIVVLEFGACT